MSREDVLEKWGDCVAERAYADRKGCEIIKENAPYYNDGLAESDVEEILKADSPREKLEAIIDKDYAEDEDWESLAEDAYYDDLDEDEQEEVDPAEFSEEFECSTTYDYEHSPIKEQTVFADIILDPAYAKQMDSPELRQLCEEDVYSGVLPMAIARIPLEDCVKLLEAKEREKSLPASKAKGYITLPAGTIYGHHRFGSGVSSLGFGDMLPAPAKIPLQAITLHNDRTPYFANGEGYSVDESCGIADACWKEGVELHAMTEKELAKAQKAEKKNAQAASR